MVACHQFVTLVWKNWLLSKRKLFWTFMEILIPIVISVILIPLRINHKVQRYNATYWKAFTIYDLPTPSRDNFTVFPQDKWELLFTPKYNVTRTIVRYVESARNDIYVVKGFNDEDSLANYVYANSTKFNILCGIVFDPRLTDQHIPPVITYKIRMQSEREVEGKLKSIDWKTVNVEASSSTQGPRQPDKNHGGEPGYTTEGFLTLQLEIGQAILKTIGNKLKTSIYNRSDISIQMQRLPYPPYTSDPFISLAGSWVPLIVLCSLIVETPTICREICMEKEKKLKDYMKIMGAHNYVHWCAWFFKYFIFGMIAVITIVVVLTVDLTPAALLRNSDEYLIFMFLFLYIIANLFFSFAIAAFFTQANSGAAAGAFLYVSTMIPYLIVVHQADVIPTWFKYAAGFFHNLVMALGFREIALHEDSGEGLRWENIRKSFSIDDDFAMFHIYIFLALDIVFYGLIMWYIEAIMPGGYADSKSFIYPFTKAYWVGHQLRPPVDEYQKKLQSLFQVPSNEFIEEDATELPQGIRIDKLSKDFKVGDLTINAVKELSLTISQGQITVLLGHNGAGKTTTISMLVGLFEPTSGTAFIGGYDILYELRNIRQVLGMCPHGDDALFDSLTVEEHLFFYARMKELREGVETTSPEEIMQMLELTHKRDCLVYYLSGGMKRRLSVAIALICGPKVLIMDEPTARMDPHARKLTCDILHKYRNGRTIFLSTHFMEEADMLGDKIAIMAGGQVQCFGSPMFLKRKLGIGYHLVMEKLHFCDEAQVAGVVQKFVKEAEIEANVSSELSFILPRESVHHFQALFSHLEKNSRNFGIASFGASITTMEEVFIRVGENTDESIIARLTTDAPPPVSDKDLKLGFRHSWSRKYADTKASMKRKKSSPYDIKKPTQQRASTTSGRSTSRSGAGGSRGSQNSSKSISFLNKRNAIRFGDPEGKRHTMPFERRKYNSVTEKLQAGMAKQKKLAGEDELQAIFNRGHHNKNHSNDWLNRNRNSYSLPSNGDPSTRRESFVQRMQGLMKTKKKSNPINVYDVMDFTGQKPRERKSAADGEEVYRDAVLDDMVIEGRLLESLQARNENLYSGSHLYFEQIMAMLVKRSIYAWRNKLQFFFILITPVFFNILACVVLKVFPSPDDLAEVPLSLDFLPHKIRAPYDIFPTQGYAKSLGDKFTDFIKKYGGDVERLNDTTQKAFDDYVIKQGNISLDLYRKKTVLGAIFKDGNFSTQDPNATAKSLITGFFNNEIYHSPAISLGVIFNTLIRHYFGRDYEIKTINKPFPRSDTTRAEAAIETFKPKALLLVIVLMLGMSFYVGSFSMFIIHERKLKFKLMQRVSGLFTTCYWAGNFLWDIAHYFIPMTISMILFYCFKIEAFTQGKNAGITMTAYLLHAWAELPFVYIVSFLFEDGASGYTWITIISLISVVFTEIMIAFQLTENMSVGQSAIDWTFAIFQPNYCFSSVLKNIYRKHTYVSVCSRPKWNLTTLCPLLQQMNRTNPCCSNVCGAYCLDWKHESYVDWTLSPCVGCRLLILFLQGVLFFFMLIYKESGATHRLWLKIITCMQFPLLAVPISSLIPNENFEIGGYVIRGKPGSKQPQSLPLSVEDSDVMRERKRILHHLSLTEHIETTAILLCEVQKYYGRFVAVDQLTLGIPRGSCFGLLGVNGAGKSTLFKLLTGDEKITFGDAFVEGFSCKTHMREVQKLLGYCPQFNAMLEEMTVREILFMYARIRGIKRHEIINITDRLIDTILLEEYTNKRIKNLSDGNKRKLSAAIALVGDPTVLLLDEPTTGMDAVSKRLLWKVLSKFQDSGKTIVLTTHSMEECEAMCTRMAIMVNGKFRCMGTTQHLKGKYGKGYTLFAKVRNEYDMTDQEKVMAFSSYIERKFPGALREDVHLSQVHYHIPDDHVTWSKLFGVMESIKDKYDLEDYTVAQTTLHQVFLNFAKFQLPPRHIPLTLLGKLLNCFEFFWCCKFTQKLYDESVQ